MQVQPDVSSGLLPDILKTQFCPPSMRTVRRHRTAACCSLLQLMSAICMPHPLWLAAGLSARCSQARIPGQPVVVTAHAAPTRRDQQRLQKIRCAAEQPPRSFSFGRACATHAPAMQAASAPLARARSMITDAGAPPMPPLPHPCARVRPDRDGDGHIEPKEIKTVMSQLGTPISDEQVKVLIQGVDTDGNGMVRTAQFRLARAERVGRQWCSRRVRASRSRRSHPH